MRRAVLVVLLAVCAAIPFFAPAGALTTRDGELVADGAWCWFQDPRAVHYVGQHDRTYIGYVTSTGDIDVVSQDHGTAALTHTTLHAALAADDHAAPGLEVLPDGHIAVFYSGHAGPHMYYRVSVKPEDVSAFGPEHIIPGSNNGAHGYTYANPIYLSAEHRTYLFFRGGNFKPSVTWSDDNLQTWAPIQTVIEPDKLQTALARPYVQYATNGVDTIALAFTDGHPRDISTNSVYAVMYRAGVLQTMTGTRLAAMGRQVTGLPQIPIHTNPITPLYDGSGPDGEAWVQDLALDSSGNPVVAFASFPTQTDHRYHYAHWTGTAWTDTEFAAAGGSIDTTGKEPNYSGGIGLDQADPATLYTSREINGQWEIQHWHTPDSGLTFDPPTAVTMNSTHKNVRPVVPWGPPGDVQVLWMAGQYDHYSASGYHTQLRELTNGPAPTTTRISAPTLTRTHTALTVSARVVQGYLGAPVAGVTAQLWGHTSGKPYQQLASATTSATGLVHFSVTQNQAMRYEVQAVGTEDWGASVSPSAVVNMTGISATRVSATPTTIRRGATVRVGMRVVDAGSGRGIAGARAQLWQQVDGGSWHYRVTLTADSAGLATTTTRPASGVTYQARYAGDSRYDSSVSSTVHVRVQ